MLTRFYVGTGFDRDGAPLASDFVLAAERHVIAHYARTVGGCTVTPSRGGWIDANGTLVIEQGIVIDVLGEINGAFEAKYLAKLFCQSSVVFAQVATNIGFSN